MKTARATLTSVSPYSQSKRIRTPKDAKETHEDHEERTWRERLHVNKQGKVFIPPMAFKNCLAEAAKYQSKKIPGKGNATYTKHIEAGVLVTEPLVLDVAQEEVEGEWLFVPSDGRRGGSKRVDKCFPVIPEWSGTVEFLIFDELVTKTVFTEFLEEAGKFIGIGRFRPRNNGYYGRFEVEGVSWK